MLLGSAVSRVGYAGKVAGTGGRQPPGLGIAVALGLDMGAVQMGDDGYRSHVGGRILAAAVGALILGDAVRPAGWPSAGSGQWAAGAAGSAGWHLPADTVTGDRINGYQFIHPVDPCCLVHLGFNGIGRVVELANWVRALSVGVGSAAGP